MADPPDQVSLKPYAGRWVAYIRGQIVGQGGTPLQAQRSARAARFKEKATVIFVPTDMPLAYPTIIYQLQALLKDKQGICLVGGAVRDALLGRPAHDLDLVLPDQAIETARQVADQMGAVFFPLKEEFDTARVIVYQENGTRLIIDFVGRRGADLTEDLQARDFTINAIAAPIEDPQQLLDPLGGAIDLMNKKLRACSETSLEEDPIRILRAIRLAAGFNLKIDPGTKSLMRDAVGSLPTTTPERQRDELLQILAGPQPATALRALDILGALEVLLPELEGLKGVEQSAPHFQDVFQHTLTSAQKLAHLLELLGPNVHPEIGGADNLMDGLLVLKLGRYREQLARHLAIEFTPERNLIPLLFLGMLYHDIGKPLTVEKDSSGRIRFFGHEQVGAEMATKRARQLRLSNQEVNRLMLMVRHHMRPLLLTMHNAPPSRRATYRFFRDTGAAGVDVCLLSLADFLATYPTQPPQELWAQHLETIRTLLASWWENESGGIAPEPFLNGNDLMDIFHLSSGPQIGQLLKKLVEAQAVGEVIDRNSAIQFIREQL